MTMSFHEVRFPMRLALGTTGGPERRTDIVALSNGTEHRNARWADARRRYDAGSGMRSIDDLYTLVAFFEARRGQLHGFRFRDPVDHASHAPGQMTTPFDQEIGIGDGVNQVFQLSKTYADAGGATAREITKPVDGTARLAIDGVELAASAFSVDPATGLVTIQIGSLPAPGASVSAGFEFDIPVRFDTERLDINLSAFRAGHIPTVPLVEIRP